MKEENELIIKQLNKFGRVPQTYELLKMIEQLESNWKELKKWLEETLNELKENDIYDRTSYETGQIISTECIIAKMEELENKNVNNK